MSWEDFWEDPNLGLNGPLDRLTQKHLYPWYSLSLRARAVFQENAGNFGRKLGVEGGGLPREFRTSLGFPGVSDP